ncbi:alkaline phosphatase D family protein [Spongiimicrobium sp. 2-473A-2-J]|uniref:alkaline phosphatase D family protein n=1 Tax=Eudoraea algarum TaxID=3417568 RepID=UPI003D361923
MRRIYYSPLLLSLFLACGTMETRTTQNASPTEFVIAFGSCNKHTLDNWLWDDVLALDPDLWVWSGDIVYADTDKVREIDKMYRGQNRVSGYRALRKETPVIGTWDDHDYGLNDGGTEFAVKRESQQVFLDFMDVPKDSPRRAREGVYAVHDYRLPAGQVKVLVLDTRYFRTALTKDTETDKRFKPNPYGTGTMLGEQQWDWLEDQLNGSKADFNIIVSSVQFWSNEHGFECWGNFPHEVDRLTELIASSGAKGTLILSGDRHISEFSKSAVKGLPYPLIDFTSSGLTHVYSDFKGEPNPYRVGEVVSTKSFGVVRLNLISKTAHLEIIGDQGRLLGKLEQRF